MSENTCKFRVCVRLVSLSQFIFPIKLQLKFYTHLHSKKMSKLNVIKGKSHLGQKIVRFYFFAIWDKLSILNFIKSQRDLGQILQILYIVHLAWFFRNVFEKLQYFKWRFVQFKTQCFNWRIYTTKVHLKNSSFLNYVLYNLKHSFLIVRS